MCAPANRHKHGTQTYLQLRHCLQPPEFISTAKFLIELGNVSVTRWVTRRRSVIQTFIEGGSSTACSVKTTENLALKGVWLHMSKKNN